MPVYRDTVKWAGWPARQYDRYRDTSRASSDWAGGEQPAASQPGDESSGLYRQVTDTRRALELSQAETYADASVEGGTGATPEGKGSTITKEVTAAASIRR